MIDISKLIEAYDTYFGDDAVVDPSKLSDEQIDEILGLEIDMTKAMDALILAKKTFGNRRLKLEKKEKLTTVIMGRLLKRIGKKERETDDGKAKFVPSIKFQVDMIKLPEEYKSYAWAKINKSLMAGESIPGVTPGEAYGSVRVY